MSDVEQIAKDARRILDNYRHGPQETELWYAAVEAVERTIKRGVAAAIAAERAKWKAFADEKGEPCKVLGPTGLFKTADGCIIMPGCRVWDSTDENEKGFDGWTVQSIERGERYAWVNIAGCAQRTTQNLYSTRESARAAAKEQP